MCLCKSLQHQRDSAAVEGEGFNDMVMYMWLMTLSYSAGLSAPPLDGWSTQRLILDNPLVFEHVQIMPQSEGLYFALKRVSTSDKMCNRLNVTRTGQFFFFFTKWFSCHVLFDQRWFNQGLAKSCIVIAVMLTRQRWQVGLKGNKFFMIQSEALQLRPYERGVSVRTSLQKENSVTWGMTLYKYSSVQLDDESRKCE